MAWNGTGSYVLNPLYSPEANGQTIDAVRYNGLTSDIAAGISATLAKNGENVPTANLPMGGFKHTGAAAASTAGEYVIWGQNATLGNLTTGTITPTSVSGASAAEIGHLVGVTSAIQTQLNAKAPTASPTFTGTVVLPSTTSIGNVSSTEIGYLDNVTSAIQTQLNAKAPTASPTFTGTVTADVLTTTGNTTLGNASTDTLNVGNGGLVKDGSGNVGIGTASPTGKLDVVGSLGTIRVETNGSDFSFDRGDANYITAKTASGFLVFRTSGTNERMQITADGYLRINGSTEGGMISSTGSGHGAFLATSAADNTFTALRLRRSGGTYTGSVAQFERDTTTVGSISVSGSATAYNTSSDYRLKNISGDLQNSGAFIDALQPRVGTWKVDGSPFVGFVAHELQAVSPSSVFGEKDGEQMQAVAYGSAELIANMVAELKSLRARVAALEA